MTSDQLQSIEHPGWLELVLNRPAKRNALTPELLRELAVSFDGAHDQAVVVLRAAGDPAFSAGFDLDVLRERGPGAHDGDPLGLAVGAIRDCPAPVVAVLQGYCWGAAVELVSGCDVRIGTSDLSIAVPANKLGSIYRPTGIDAIVTRFGMQTAIDLFVFGMTFNADKALARGLVSAVVDRADVDDHVQTLVNRILSSPETPRTHKKFLQERENLEGPADEFWTRWEAFRAAAVESRTIPDVRSSR